MQTVKITTSQNIEIEYALATLGDRILARLIDYGIYFGIYIVCLIVYLSTQSLFHPSTEKIGMYFMLAAWLLLSVFYDLLTEVFYNGQSVGKKAMKIKVISLSGARPTAGQYLLRWIFRLVDFGITGGTLAVVSVAVTDNHQRIGDVIAGTTLVKTQPLTAFNDLVFGTPDPNHVLSFKEAALLNDADIALVHDVIRYFRSTRNNMAVYKTAMQLKKVLNVNYSTQQINDYQFLQIIVQDYISLTSGTAIINAEDMRLA